MLTKKEKAVMSVIYSQANNKMGTCLIRPDDLLASVPYSIEISKDEMETIMSDLAMDEYFELVDADKKGSYFYCITLMKKGFAFARSELLDKRDRRRAFWFKILLCATGAVATVLVQWIVRKFIS